MTRFGIVGGGKGATLQADAIIQTRGTDLIGVGGRTRTDGAISATASEAELAAVADVTVRPLDELCAEADALIVAVPPSEVAGVVADIATCLSAGGRRGPSVRAVLIEPPLLTPYPVGGPTAVDPEATLPGLPVPTVLGANLLHAPVVRQALREIARMNAPHHLQMRIRQPAPTWGAHGTPAFGGPLHDPGMRLVPVLLSAAAEAAVYVEVTEIAGGIHAAIELESNRRAGLDVAWAEGSSRIELEAADDSGVILLTLDPLPRLEIDGRPIPAAELHPLEALGFVGQIDRLAKTAAGAEAWPPLSVGESIEALFARHAATPPSD